MKKSVAVAAAIVVVAACGRPHPDIEAIMRQNLAEIRKSIRDFRTQNRRLPTALKELVPRYLRAIPKDPVTGAADWRTITEEPVRLDEFRKALPLVVSGVVDVRSAAPGRDAHGKPWSEY